MKICNEKNIREYANRFRQFNPNEEREKIKEQIKIRNKIRQQQKKDEDSMYISVQRKILDWVMSFFQKTNKRKSKTDKAIIKWFEDLFKVEPITRKPYWDHLFR